MVRTEYKYHTLGGFGRSISHSRKGREGKWRTYLVGRRSAVEGKAEREREREERRTSGGPREAHKRSKRQVARLPGRRG